MADEFEGRPFLESEHYHPGIALRHTPLLLRCAHGVSPVGAPAAGQQL